MENPGEVSNSVSEPGTSRGEVIKDESEKLKHEMEVYPFQRGLVKD
jgi:hypothetical protein